ncbi:hypothetical protein LQG66_17650 [Bradyrhizobium ontarionense]|uniref:Uncharacterized protein n=1 Tax=Bradyrhizobium ontarionense TaxID=2898149 RepID=A0ABY3RMC5_9BRAD|nr:hypothetical protein [Bradyrhizobium sp. A19]UFZ08006.1 hypothetical protein LQG66_17650 [Bradyrhizobium sp. A19]
MGFDAKKQKDDEYYADIVDKWEKAANLDHWHAWTSFVLGGGQPSIDQSIDRQLTQLSKWLLSRVWPECYTELESAFSNFLRVANDFCNVFHKHTETSSSDHVYTRKFYQIEEWNPQLYSKLSKQYDHHVDLVQDLLLELTRAANLVCDRVRKDLMPSYRLEEGRLLVSSGPTMDLKIHTFSPQYSREEKELERPYPGLEKFMDVRERRDIRFGKGPAPS